MTQNRIITVDYQAPDAAKQFEASIRNTGFGVIANHPISEVLMEGVYQEWADFFNSDAKHGVTFEQEVQAGYFPMLSENAKDHPVKDLKEFYHFYPWFDNAPNISQYTAQLRDQMVRIASTLLDWIEQEAEPSVAERFSEKLSSMIVNSRETLLRAIHYPPLQGTEEPGSVRAAAHEDINLLTVLPAATQPGLEVQDVHGDWHAVSCDPGTLVVNSGDMLSEASGGYYPSTTHRVVNPPIEQQKKSRYSLPLFLHPRGEVQLSKKYTAASYLHERLVELGLK